MYGFTPFFTVLDETAISLDLASDTAEVQPNPGILPPMEGVDRCDWGCLQRTTEMLARLNSRTLFAVSVAE